MAGFHNGWLTSQQFSSVLNLPPFLKLYDQLSCALSLRIMLILLSMLTSFNIELERSLKQGYSHHSVLETIDCAAQQTVICLYQDLSLTSRNITGPERG